MDTRTGQLRRWHIIALVGVFVLLGAFFAMSSPDVGSRLSFDTKNWRVYASEAVFKGSEGVNRIVTTRHVGPVTITSRRWEVDQHHFALGTNQFRIGDLLYDSHSRR
jgi:hypothetical protein